MRVRFRFAKTGRVRWTSHRDVARAWERALRRARLPVAYTEGFSPRPRLSFGLALPTGLESTSEYLDALLVEPVECQALPGVLSSLLPGGVEVMAAAEVDAAAGSLQDEVSSCSWELEVEGPETTVLAERVAAVLASPRLDVVRERKGRRVADDLRPTIVLLRPGTGPGLLQTELATRPRGVRPAELVATIGAGLELVRGLRTCQWIDRDGARREPLPLGATDALRAIGRAS